MKLSAIILVFALIQFTDLANASNREKTWDDLNRIISEQVKLGHYAYAIKNAEEALAIARKSFGPKNMKTAISLQQLSELYRKQTKVDKADALSQEAIEIWNQTLGSEKEIAIQLKKKFVKHLASRGQYEKSLKAYNEVIKEEKEYFGENHTMTATSLIEIANIYWQQKNHKEALVAHEKAIAIFELVLDGADQRLRDAYQNIANQYFEISQYRKAAPHYRNFLESQIHAFGSSDWRLSSAYLAIAENAEKLYDYYDAEQSLLKAIEIIKNDDGPEMENKKQALAHALYRMREFYIGRGRERDAKQYIDEAEKLQSEKTHEN